MPPVVHALQDTVFKPLHEFDVLAKSFCREVIARIDALNGADKLRRRGCDALGAFGERSSPFCYVRGVGLGRSECYIEECCDGRQAETLRIRYARPLRECHSANAKRGKNGDVAVIGVLLLTPGAKHVKATDVNHNNHMQGLLPVHHRDGLIVDT
jgi:hypothetical protein